MILNVLLVLWYIILRSIMYQGTKSAFKIMYRQYFSYTTAMVRWRWSKLNISYHHWYFITGHCRDLFTHALFARNMTSDLNMWIYKAHQVSNAIKSFFIRSVFENRRIISLLTAAVAQRVRALAPQAEGWVFKSQPRQTKVVKTGSDSPTAKRSAIGVSVTGTRRWPLLNGCPVSQ